MSADDSETRYFGDTLQGLSEAAPILAEKYNEITRRYAQYQDITEDEMLELLETHVSPQEFHWMMNNDFSQGVLIGKLLTLNDVQMFLDDAEGEDEDVGEDW